MIWLFFIAAVYILFIAFYCFGHSIGYDKGRRDTWEGQQK